jgi:hypothetical protein
MEQCRQISGTARIHTMSGEIVREFISDLGQKAVRIFSTSH